MKNMLCREHENISAYVEKDNKTGNVRIRLTLRSVRATIVVLEKN